MKKNSLIIGVFILILILVGCTSNIENNPKEVSKSFISAYLKGDHETLITLVSEKDVAQITQNKANFETVKRLNIEFELISEEIQNKKSDSLDVVYRLTVKTQTTDKREKEVIIPLKLDGNKWIVDVDSFKLEKQGENK